MENTLVQNNAGHCLRKQCKTDFCNAHTYTHTHVRTHTRAHTLTGATWHTQSLAAADQFHGELVHLHQAYGVDVGQDAAVEPTRPHLVGHEAHRLFHPVLIHKHK